MLLLLLLLLGFAVGARTLALTCCALRAADALGEDVARRNLGHGPHKAAKGTLLAGKVPADLVAEIADRRGGMDCHCKEQRERRYTREEGRSHVGALWCASAWRGVLDRRV